jgi:nucleotide-binding universal stress UspA family protein
VGQEAVFNPDCPIAPLLLPVDGSEASLLAVRQGAALATRWKHCKPNLTLLHALDFVRVSASLNAGTPFLVKESEGILAAGGEILRDAGLEGFFTDKLQVGDPARLITEEAQAGHYALVLMGARGLSSMKQLFLGGVSSDVLHRVSEAVVGIVYHQAGRRITGDNIGEEG